MVLICVEGIDVGESLDVCECNSIMRKLQNASIGKIAFNMRSDMGYGRIFTFVLSKGSIWAAALATRRLTYSAMP
jgi:hypothetical protein